jgi:hypothetical protein
MNDMKTEATTMLDHQNRWPMDIPQGNLSSLPLVFDARGYLVAILDDAAEAERARLTLRSAEFAEHDLRVYSSEQILENHDRFLAQRSLARRVVGALTDDRDTITLYFGYARDGRAALWARVADRKTANRAIAAIADLDVLHIRHYGRHDQDDIHIR